MTEKVNLHDLKIKPPEDLLAYAEKAGVEIGDIISAVNGQKISSSHEILKIIKESDLRSGNRIKLTLYRDGKTLTKYIILARVQ